MRIRTLLKFGVLFTLIIFALGKLFLFLDSELFTITKVDIKGEYFISNPGLVDVIKNLRGENIWYINTKKIGEYASEDIRVKSLSVKKILPDTIVLEIEERTPYSYVLLNNRIYVCDEEGTIFAYRTETIKKDMIILNISHEDEIEKLIKILNKISSLRLSKQVSEIYYNEKTINLVLKDGVEFRTNTNIGEQKYKTAYNLYSKLKLEGSELRYIDLSSENNQLIVK
jgi:cell division protein FtsQ